MSLYPLKFNTIYKEKLWGGQKIKTVLKKDFGALANCGEAWELSGVQENVSIISNGSFAGINLTSLIADKKGELVGGSIYERFGDEFPLLIKFIDAERDLSIQVHPDDRRAKERHNGSGKTEMWYLLQADSKATLINGFNKNTDKAAFINHLKNGTLVDILNREEANEGDVFYLPAGRVHTIGRGLLLAEIQQASDLTYRIYDFDRTDKDGNKRELHTDLAIDAIDYRKPAHLKSYYERIPNQVNNIVASPFFTTNKIDANQKISIDRSELDSFKIYISVKGAGRIAGEAIKLGEVMLVPAAIKKYNIEPDNKLELLESYIQL